MSRERILAALRSQELPEAPLPKLDERWGTGRAHRRTRFAAALEAAGGRCVRVSNRAELTRELKGLPEFANARRRASVVPHLGDPNVSLGELDDPRRLAQVDYALLPGQFGVAENGGVWIDATDYLHRAVLFLPEHLGLVVKTANLVNHMHDAYKRIGFDGPGFGCFIAGPSKTADIEQALVIGAHGARSLTVFLQDAD